MKQAVLGLGTNMGVRGKNLAEAVQALRLLPKTTVLRYSTIYETVPFDVEEEQPDYLNQCAVVMTELSPNALLGACLGIEAAMGRVRQEKTSSRIIDIDLLLYEGETMKTPELVLPHPEMLKRAFVLVPLAELFPEEKALGLDFSAALSRVDQDLIRHF